MFRSIICSINGRHDQRECVLFIPILVLLHTFFANNICCTDARASSIFIPSAIGHHCWLHRLGRQISGVCNNVRSCFCRLSHSVPIGANHHTTRRRRVWGKGLCRMRANYLYYTIVYIVHKVHPFRVRSIASVCNECNNVTVFVRPVFVLWKIQ